MKKIKLDIVLNLLIFGLVVMSTVFMLTGFYFMGEERQLSAERIEAFKFFTVDSNVIMGVMALVFARYEILLIRKKINIIPNIIYGLKLATTVSVVLTFLVTAFFLAPIVEDGYFSLFKNSNLFFHLIIPILSFLSFICFEKNEKLEFKYTFVGIIPMILYAIFYTINILMHLENGKVSVKYDWYWFLQGNINAIVFVIPIMFVVTYCISFVIWKLNKRN